MIAIKELTIDVAANTKKLTKQLNVIKNGIELILNGLENIEKGCPKCGHDKVVFGSVEFVDGKANKMVCRECGCAYVYGE